MVPGNFREKNYSIEIQDIPKNLNLEMNAPTQPPELF